QTAGAEGAAHRKTVDGIHVKSSKSWNTTEKIKSLLETLVFVLVSFDNTGDLATGAVPQKRFRETIGLLAMIYGLQHTRNYGHLGARRHELAHQLPCQAAV